MKAISSGFDFTVLNVLVRDLGNADLQQYARVLLERGCLFRDISNQYLEQRKKIIELAAKSGSHPWAELELASNPIFEKLLSSKSMFQQAKMVCSKCGKRVGTEGTGLCYRCELEYENRVIGG
jgi:hypothetical protein